MNTTILKVFIGGISAFVLYLFINSQFVSGLFSISLKKPETIKYSCYIISFLAGFSERLVF